MVFARNDHAGLSLFLGSGRSLPAEYITILGLPLWIHAAVRSDFNPALLLAVPLMHRESLSARVGVCGNLSMVGSCLPFFAGAPLIPTIASGLFEAAPAQKPGR